jgi:dolichyl-phosphate beta-glucosyltransferase
MRRWVPMFVAVGGVVTALDVALLALLHVGAGWPLVPADAVALTAAAVTSYVLNRAVTFGADPFVRWVRLPSAFVVGAVAAGVLDVAVLVAVGNAVGIDTYGDLVVAKLPAVFVAALFRLAWYRTVLFRVIRAEQDQRVARPAAPGAARLSVVIPAYEEEERIGGTVTRVRSALEGIDGGVEIVIVDDGSADRTADAARTAGADVVVVQARNQGKGAAVRAGVAAAGGRTIAFTDADLAYPPEQLPVLLEAVEDGWDVVVGNRRHPGTETLVAAPSLRAVGGRAINALTQAMLLGQYRDTQCGLKAFRSDVARLLFGKGRIDGFAFDIELMHLVERYRLSLLEVPVRVQNSSRSTVRVARDALHLVRDLFRIRRWADQGRYELDSDEAALLARH